MIISVTGTPATGKTTFAKELSEKMPNSKIIELNDLVDQYKLFSSTDEFGSKIVRLKELENKANALINEHKKSSNLIIVGHLVPEIKISQDLIVVLRLNLKELIKRLEERNYQREKIRENIISEATDYCGAKSREICDETYEIETEAQRKEMLEYITSKLKGVEPDKPESREINKFDELLMLVTDEGNKYGL